MYVTGKASIHYTLYATCGMRMRKGMRVFFLLRICYVTSKSSVNSLSFAFAFAPIDTGTDSFATFAFAFTPMEALQYIYIIFYLFIACEFACTCHV